MLAAIHDSDFDVALDLNGKLWLFPNSDKWEDGDRN